MIYIIHHYFYFDNYFIYAFSTGTAVAAFLIFLGAISRFPQYLFCHIERSRDAGLSKKDTCSKCKAFTEHQ